MFDLSTAIMTFDMCFNIVLFFNIVLYRHANVTARLNRMINSGYMALYKYIQLLLLLLLEEARASTGLCVDVSNGVNINECN